ncbi:MAG: 3-hydroxybutyrate oligomer hydrolase family protein [Candidatus Competibacter denitrificans]
MTLIATQRALALVSLSLIAFAIPAGANPPSANGHDYYPRHSGIKNLKPSYITGTISARYYSAGTCPTSAWCEAGDDLLTGGLGKTGLAQAAPTFADPLAPSPAELRRNAIHTNYRAVLDILATGGYGTLYGPNVTNAGVIITSEGKIPGWEYIAYADDGTGRQNVMLMVQIPDSFDSSKPCIVTATSSGSRGIYGAIGASGEWGLKQGCAVAYTDKGTGNGLYDLMSHSVGLIDGTRAHAMTAGKDSLFTAALSEAQRATFNARTPDRVAYKHAHSQQNPERNWGTNTLQAVHLAFYLLNEKFAVKGPDGNTRITISPANTLVIASGVSNGGTSALQAAEQDLGGLIDGVAITEPNAQPANLRRLQIMQGTTAQLVIGKPLLDYFTVANLYQPCAALAVASITNLLIPANAQARCQSLHDKGLVAGADPAAWAADALAKLRAYGWLADSDLLHASHYALATPAIAMTYANALGRASVLDNVCGYSFGNTDTTGNPIPQVAATQTGTFATANGIPPTSGVNLIYNLAANATAGVIGKRDTFAASPSTGRIDYALDGALCHRNLVIGADSVEGRPLTTEDAAYARRLQQGIAEVQLSARLRGKPTLIVHGRADALVPVNHASRAYYGANRLIEGNRHQAVSYIEVTNAQHFDGFLAFPDYAARYIPLHVYLIRALNAMYQHLTAGTALPPSQVVRTVPRGASGSPSAPNPITATNVPPIAENPATGDLIRFGQNTLYIPD